MKSWYCAILEIMAILFIKVGLAKKDQIQFSFHILIIRFPFGCSFQNGLNDTSIIYGYRVMSKNVSKLRENRGGITIKWSQMPKNGHKWIKRSDFFFGFLGAFWLYNDIVIIFQCFSDVNENLAGKQLNGQEKKLSLIFP